jgi:excisionase family DNA binding protein
MEIRENEVYTPKETQALLKVSSSTMTRLIKNGLIRSAKVGKQYRIMGKEILRMLSPKLEDRIGKVYNKGRRWIHNEGVSQPKAKEKMRPSL